MPGHAAMPGQAPTPGHAVTPGLVDTPVSTAEAASGLSTPRDAALRLTLAEPTPRITSIADSKTDLQDFIDEHSTDILRNTQGGPGWAATAYAVAAVQLDRGSSEHGVRATPDRIELAKRVRANLRRNPSTCTDRAAPLESHVAGFIGWGGEAICRTV